MKNENFIEYGDQKISQEFYLFLVAVKEHGVIVYYWESGQKLDKYIDKGGDSSLITDDNLVDFMPLNRQDRRKIFG